MVATCLLEVLPEIRQRAHRFQACHDCLIWPYNVAITSYMAVIFQVKLGVKRLRKNGGAQSFVVATLSVGRSMSGRQKSSAQNRLRPCTIARSEAKVSVGPLSWQFSHLLATIHPRKPSERASDQIFTLCIACFRIACFRVGLLPVPVRRPGSNDSDRCPG